MKLSILLTGLCMAELASSPLASAQESVEKRLERLESEYAKLKQEMKQSGKEGGKGLFDRLHFHGYGEVHYSDQGSVSRAVRDKADADAHRFVLGWEYEFTDDIRFSGEVDYEHAATEMELEYAHLDIDINENLTFRAGSVLMPFGMLNEFHEPPNFYSVDRPVVERSLIPTTWQEIGFGFVGQNAEAGIAYRVYLVNGLNADSFTARDGVRSGRAKGAEADAEDLAFIGRIEFALNKETKLGSSVYYGGADQDVAGLGRVTVGMYEADIQWRHENWDFKGSYVFTKISNADNVSAVTGQTIGDKLQGWYAEAGYHAKGLFAPNSEKDLVVFLRREDVNTHHSVARGFSESAILDRNAWTCGIAYFPVRKVVLKADYERWRDDAGSLVGRFNLGVGWMF